MARDREQQLAEWRAAEQLRDELEDQYRQRTLEHGNRARRQLRERTVPARPVITMYLPD